MVAGTVFDTATERLPGILPHHLAHLRASGLTDATITANGLRSETNVETIASLLKWGRGRKQFVPAIVFPFTRRDGTNGYCRVRPDNPIKLGGKEAKYLSPRGEANQVYIPHDTRSALDNPERNLLITEGEKKALAADQYGFPCLGLVGVFGWKPAKEERLLPDLEQIAWRGRKVFIAFDSDVAHKPEVAEAMARLSAHLAARGAIVRVVYLPEGPIGTDGKAAKVGLDDYLVAADDPRRALRELMNAAEDPPALGTLELREAAAKLDPATEAKDCLMADAVDGLPILRFWKGSFIVWRHGCYREVQASEIRGRLVEFLNARWSMLNSSRTSDVLDQLRAQSRLGGFIEPPTFLADGDGWNPRDVLATRSQLIHLPSYAAGIEYTRPTTPKFFTTAATDYDFDASAPPPKNWLKFLGSLWPDDQQSIDTLQEWFGYTITPDLSHQKIFGIIGPMRCGKGTIARVQRAMIGEQNVCGPTLAGLATNFGLWPLIGKSLAIISDARLSGKSDQSVVVERLLSISGEDALTIDRKCMEPITCKLPTRLMLLSNELPKLGDASGAITSRFILTKIDRSWLGKEDKGLFDRLLGELPGILLWAIDGWKRLRDRGRFQQPDTAIELLGQMHELSSPVWAFVKDRCMVGPQYQVSVASLFAAWQEWCEANGWNEKHGTKQTFGRDLRAVLPAIHESQPRDTDGSRFRVYVGIGIRYSPLD